VCALVASCPSAETAALGLPQVRPPARAWPQVEVVRPGAEGRAPRLVQALREVRRAFVYAPNPGYGIAQVCKACGAPAACASCGGMLRSQEGGVRCIVCEAPGRCAACGASSFGIRRGGAERVEEWVGRVVSVPVARPERARLPATSGEVLIGGPELVRDLGAGDLDLVAIMDADQAAARPGLGARERALSTWMEAAGWARPKGRVIVQSAHPSDPAVQALVRGNADRFHARERERRAAAGFPVGAAVFRVVGTDELEAEVRIHEPFSLLTTGLGGRTVCLLALDLARIPAFGAAMRTLAAAGVVERVEAEPHI
jgi:primosomal protein N' (replication factor Y)